MSLQHRASDGTLLIVEHDRWYADRVDLKPHIVSIRLTLDDGNGVKVVSLDEQDLHWLCNLRTNIPLVDS